MPSIFNLFGYTIYFYSNENNEPIHLHICKGKPKSNATKVWITSRGDIILAHNKSRIPNSDLNKIISHLKSNIHYIETLWLNYFGYLTYYC